jgi:cytochrome P450 family 142 subfamily A polypeptide 1
MAFNDVDLLDLHVHGLHSEPLYEWLREEAPLYWDATNSLWAVSRYDDVVFVSKHTELFCNRFGVVPGIPLDRWPDEAMINKDGEEHTCQRALVSKGFTPRRIAELETRMRGIVDELIDRVADKGECDVVADFARPFPMRVIGEMLGYPKERNDEILGWTDVIVQAGNGPKMLETFGGELIETFAKFCTFHNQISNERKEKRGNDLISVWLDAEIGGQQLGDTKIMYEHNLLLVGGSETTRHAISIGMLELLKRPEDMKYLREHRDAIPNAAEEMVRWTTPFVRMQRTLLADHEMYGKTMKKGDKMVMLYPAANRDPRAFEQPQKFDIRRSFAKPSLAFGYGKHYCLGASLARLEIETFLGRVLDRLPDMRLAKGREPTPSVSSFLRGLVSLPATFTPERGVH